ncbi:MAG: hypothetical protein BroJett040_00800 [Oligoflexia bacterium]|nr:MAG: hypothetical protein BroJett040_00800 [Oligoflexia bacterium]
MNQPSFHSENVGEFKQKSKEALIIHLYYHDLWDDIEYYLNQLPPIDIFITTVHKLDERIVNSLKKYNCFVITVPNRGRDIAPFLEVLKIILRFNYLAVGKIHTKKSPQTQYCPWLPTLTGGRAWQEDLFKKMLSRDSFDLVSSAFAAQPRLGIVAPQGHLVPIREFIGDCSAFLDALRGKLPSQLYPIDFNFPAGSMFWFRPESLEKVLDLNLSLDDFESEPLAIDGSLAHALERFFPLVSIIGGFKVTSTDRLKVVPGSQNELFSIITRFHDISRLNILSFAVKSIISQSYQNIEWIISVKNFGDGDIKKLDDFIKSCGLASGYRIINNTVAPPVDGRSKILNAALAVVSGRYLSFLDYDDTISPDFCSLMRDVLSNSPSAVSVGGCAQIYFNAATNEIIQKTFPYNWGRPIDIFWSNFIPIHSFALDRSKIKNEELFFDEKLDCVEDYDLLLRLASKYEMDYTLRHFEVCQYYIRNDGTNTTLELKANPSPHESEKWLKCEQILKSKRNDLYVTLNVRELRDYICQIRSTREPAEINLGQIKLFVKNRLKEHRVLLELLRISYVMVRGAKRKMAKIRSVMIGFSSRNKGTI